MEKFFGTIIVILLVIYALRLIGRLVFPWLLKRMVNKMQNRANEQFSSMFGGQFGEQAHYNDGQETYSDSKEPRVTITRLAQKDKEKPSSYSELDGQYVDYEEIK